MVRRLVTGVMALACFVAVTEQEAAACSLACPMMHLLPEDGASVPANAPGFLYVPPPAPWASTEEPLELFDGADALVATRKEPYGGGFLLAPEQQLALGTHTLRYASCASLPRQSLSFQVTAASPFPAVAGELRATTGVASVEVATQRGSCVEPVEAATAQLSVVTSAELAPFLSLVRWQVEVDGASWTGPSSLVGPIGDAAGTRALTVFSVCGDAGPHVVQHGTTLGKHHVRVTAAIDGAPALSPMEIDVDLSCSGPRIATGGGATASPSGAPPSSGSGSGSGSDESCTIGALGVATPPSAFFALLAAAVLAGLRRRR
ncbi:MAG: hypothetical protein KIT84_16920 [Labilithrix sp.]|nr:hypothetical protein [Labilithrix sp.]MCW5812712.1 hypothetical protein [Labilithrix sp.]